MPSERHAAVGQRVPYCVIDNGFAVEACELILPVRVAVGIGYGVGCGKSGYILNGGAIRILRFGEDISAVIVGIDNGFVAVGVILADQLVQFSILTTSFNSFILTAPLGAETIKVMLFFCNSF